MEEKLSSLIPFVAILIPILSIILGIGIGMLALILNYRKRKEIFALYHQERMAAIEKGTDCPPWPERLLADETASPSPRRHLLKGLVWLFIGIAVTLALFVAVGHDQALWGLIPAGIGLAHLIYYFVEGKKEAEAVDQAASARRP